MPDVECRRFDGVAAELALGVADSRERSATMAHLDHCARCQQELARLSDVADGLVVLAPPLEPPAGFESRVLAALPTQEASPPGHHRPEAAVRRPLRRVAPSRRRLLQVAAVVVAAVAVAAGNAATLDLAGRCRFEAGDWGDGLTGRFDIIVANPPYLTRREIDETAPEVRDFEPHLALDGGMDGLDAYRRLAPEIARLLGAEGFAAVEIGRGQGDAVRALFAAAGLEARDRAADLGGIERCLVFGHAAEAAAKTLGSPQIAQQTGRFPI